MAVRWYSANLTNESKLSTIDKDSHSPTKKNGDLNEGLGLTKTDAPSHRRSSDISIDHAIGKAISKHKFGEFSKLSKDEHIMLQWNMKNVEYALGANISDLSMKFWDSDERHAFEGDHVLLREGYSTIVDYMVKKIETYGNSKFKPMLNFPIGKVEYARRSTTQQYQDEQERKLVELSDSCCVTSEDESTGVKCDFVVCTLPLGVLKHAVASPTTDRVEGSGRGSEGVVFEPPLPMSKQDSINTVGFGLLNKLYLQFPSAFWRKPLGLEGDNYLFGNSSGINPYYYMFTDLGMTLGEEDDCPPILMTLVSGKEAVHCEMLTEQEMVREALEALGEILKPIKVPAPVAVRRTKWGMDKFSRGCYTFLPPGATDQDFNMLQSPLNGNGDSLLLEGSETMRMFFAGEHTTALHPSMAHGAMLSGIRAAKEIVSTLSFSFRSDKASDRLIPVALFRRDNPDTPLQCNLCHETGSRVREGSLLALKRGARQVLVHNNCAEYSPEVEVYEGQWRHVIKAVNRGKALTCTLCNRTGATIGCTHQNCFRVYHFSCSEDTGWRFDREGKVYYCDLHRKNPKGNEADRVSLKFYKSKTANAVLRCFLCGGADDDDKTGKLLAFQRQNRRVLVHEKCARFTTVVDTKEDTESRMGIEFHNIFDAIEKATTCAKCSRHGATVGCHSCHLCYHYPCALETAWNGGKKGRKFYCEYHQKHRPKNGVSNKSGIFQHALFSLPSSEGADTTSAPSNSDIGSAALLKSDSREEFFISDDSSDSDGSSFCHVIDNADVPLMATSELSAVELSEKLAEEKNVRVTRHSETALWSFSLVAKKIAGHGKDYVLAVGNKTSHAMKGLEGGQVILSINEVEVGTSSLRTFKDVLSYLGTQVDLHLIVKPALTKPDATVSGMTALEGESQAIADDFCAPHPETVGSDAFHVDADDSPLIIIAEDDASKLEIAEEEASKLLEMGTSAAEADLNDHENETFQPDNSNPSTDGKMEISNSPELESHALSCRSDLVRKPEATGPTSN
jgi:Flavin containing amine oxidoreductase/PHD-like zinc-binding domain